MPFLNDNKKVQRRRQKRQKIAENVYVETGWTHFLLEELKLFLNMNKNAPWSWEKFIETSRKIHWIQYILLQSECLPFLYRYFTIPNSREYLIHKCYTHHTHWVKSHFNNSKNSFEEHFRYSFKFSLGIYVFFKFNLILQYAKWIATKSLGFALILFIVDDFWLYYHHFEKSNLFHCNSI